MQNLYTEQSSKETSSNSAPAVVIGSSSSVPIREQPPDPPDSTIPANRQQTLTPTSIAPPAPKKEGGIRWKDEIGEEADPASSPSFHPSESEGSLTPSPTKSVKGARRFSAPKAVTSAIPEAAPLTPTNRLACNPAIDDKSLNKLTSKIDHLITFLNGHFDQPIRGLQTAFEASSDQNRLVSDQLKELILGLVDTNKAVSSLDNKVSSLSTCTSDAVTGFKEWREALGELTRCVKSFSSQVGSEDAAKLLIKMTAQTVRTTVQVVMGALTMNQPPPSSEMEQLYRTQTLQYASSMEVFSDQIDKVLGDPVISKKLFPPSEYNGLSDSCSPLMYWSFS